MQNFFLKKIKRYKRTFKTIAKLHFQNNITKQTAKMAKKHKIWEEGTGRRKKSMFKALASRAKN